MNGTLESLTHAELLRLADELQRMNVGLINRLTAACEVMGKVANKMEPCRCELERAREVCNAANPES